MAEFYIKIVLVPRGVKQSSRLVCLMTSSSRLMPHQWRTDANLSPVPFLWSKY